MARTLRARHAKQFRDKARAHVEGTAPKRHKVAEERSKKAKYRKNNRA